MRIEAWVKFHESRVPEKFVGEHFDDFWNQLREFMMRNQVRLDWLIIT